MKIKIIIFLLLFPTIVTAQGKSFDGITDFVSIVENGSLDFSSEITIEYDFMTPNGDSGRIISKWAELRRTWQTDINLVPGEMRIELGDLDQTAKSGEQPITGFVNGRWYHIAWTFDSAGNLYGYLDGVRVVSATGLEPGLGTSNDLVNIGRDSGGTQYTECSLDNIRLWNVARTQAQINSWKGKRIPGAMKEAGLRLNLCFNKRTGTPVDLAGYNNDVSAISGTLAIRGAVSVKQVLGN